MAHPESSPSHGARSRSKNGALRGSASDDDEQRDTVELDASELSRLKDLDPDDEDRETVEITEPPPFSSEAMSSSPFSTQRELAPEKGVPEEYDSEEERVAWHTIPAPPPSGAEED